MTPFHPDQTSVAHFGTYRDARFWNYPLQGLLAHEDGITMIYVYQEKIAPVGPAPAKPPDVLTLQHTIESLQQENAWLKEQLARIVRDK